MASLAAIFKQVEREGRRWGLVPVLRDGKVAVAEMLSEIPPVGPGRCVVPEKGPRVICSLDENSPMDAFALILSQRVKRHQHDFMRMVKARQDRIYAEQRAEADLRRKDLRAQLMARVVRGRQIFTGIGR